MDLSENLAPKHEPLLNARDTARYKRLLLAKRDELAAAAGGAESLVPPANDTSGDLGDTLAYRSRASDPKAPVACAPDTRD